MSARPGSAADGCCCCLHWPRCLRRLRGAGKARRLATELTAALEAAEATGAPDTPSTPELPSALRASRRMPGEMPDDPAAMLAALGLDVDELIQDDDVREFAAGHGFDIDLLRPDDDIIEPPAVPPRQPQREPRLAGLIVRVNLCSRADECAIGVVQTFHGPRDVYALRVESRSWSERLLLRDQKVYLLGDLHHGRRAAIALVRVRVLSGRLEPCAPLRAVATDAHRSSILPFDDDVRDAVWLLLRDAVHVAR